MEGNSGNRHILQPLHFPLWADCLLRDPGHFPSVWDELQPESCDLWSHSV